MAAVAAGFAGADVDCTALVAAVVEPAEGLDVGAVSKLTWTREFTLINTYANVSTITSDV